MALAWPHTLLFRSQSSFSATNNFIFFSDLPESRSIETLWPTPLSLVRRSNISLLSSSPSLTPRVICFSKSTEDKQQWTTEAETVVSDSDSEARDDEIETRTQTSSVATNGRVGQRISTSSSGDSSSLGIREPVYEVVEVKSNGTVSTRNINRRQLLKLSGLRPRDIRSVDPSLFLTNSMPSLLVREYAILLNLGSLRAIAMQERVLIFDYNRKGGKAFLESLLPRLNPKNNNGGPSMPFELELNDNFHNCSLAN